MDDDAKIDGNLELPQKTWTKVVNAARKGGYREGVEAGKESVFQQGFDVGYADGFKTAFMLGKYKGIAAAMSHENDLSSDVQIILDKTRRGACYICSKGSTATEDKDNNDKLSLEDVRKDQQQHSETIVGMLRDHFDTLSNQHAASTVEVDVRK